MANTGNKQAIIAYKVSKPGGEPLDVDGILTRISGKKQAIALLTGQINPNPNRYEVEFYYNKNETLTGNPSVSRDVVSCPVGYITVSPNRIVLDPDMPTIKVTLESSSTWRLIQQQNTATIDFTSGSAGTYEMTITRTGNIGQGYFIFRNEATLETATLYIINVISKPWVLDTGTWNMLGFWYNNGIWKYNP